jgi:transposase
MARYRTYTIEFKRRLVEEHLSGGAGLSELARRHDLSRELLRTWVKKHEAGELVAGGRPATPDRCAHEAKIAGLERKVGQLTMELDLLKRGLASARRPRDASCSVVSGPGPAASEPGAAS